MSDEQRRADELVSAYLDGEATPAEIAEVERDDALSARAEQLRAVRDAVAAPVPPMSAESRDRMIEAALAAAGASTAHQPRARIVPLHRRHQTRLAVAAAVVLLAAVVSAGLIASRGDDDPETAAEAPAETADAAPVATEMAEADMAATEMAEADMAATETAEMDIAEAAEAEMDIAEIAEAAEAEIAEAIEEESMAAPSDRLETAEAATANPEAAEARQIEEAPVPEADAAAMESAAVDETDEPSTDETASAVSEDRGEADTADAAESEDGATGQVVDLGVFDSLESLLDGIAARLSDALEDGAAADPGTCSAAVRETALELGGAGQPFIAAVGADDPPLYDARLVRRADGTEAVVYAAPPDCETAIH